MNKETFVLALGVGSVVVLLGGGSHGVGIAVGMCHSTQLFIRVQGMGLRSSCFHAVLASPKAACGGMGLFHLTVSGSCPSSWEVRQELKSRKPEA